MTPSERRHSADTIVYAVLFLFFFQLISEFVEAIYAFGLLGTGIPTEIVSVILFFAPVLLLLWPGALKGRAALIPPFVMIICRLIAAMVGTRERMLISGVGVAGAMIWLPALLWQLGRDEIDKTPQSLGLGLLLAVLSSILFRTAGSGLDLSTRGPFQAVAWLLAAVAAFLLIRRAPTAPTHLEPSARGLTPFVRLVVLSLGLSSALILLYFAYTSPNVVARWSEASYPAVVITLVVGMGLPAALGLLRRGPLLGWSKGTLWIINTLFITTLVVALRIHQLHFPVDPAAYPRYAPDVTLVHQLPLFVMLLLVSCIFVDFSLLAHEIVSARPSLWALGGAFTVSSLYWVAMVFAHVFTTVYDYIPMVGPAFRDRFWLVHLIAGLGLVLPLLAVRRLPRPWNIGAAWGATIALMGLAAVGAVLVTMARPSEPPPKPALTVVTYNIQQGYTDDGQKGFEDQLAVLRALDADIIGLQESDTNRISGGNADLVRAFADALDMYSYYGPTTVVGTFGIALLSRYPIEQPRTFFMYSIGEQTATIEALISVGDVTYNVFVTHLGNGGPIVQQEAILQIVEGRQNVILMGDFNFRPDTPQYALTTALFDDAWLRRWPEGVEDSGLQPTKRIDHIFISRELDVEDARFIDDPASDHPAVMAVLRSQ